ncbi:unnamed protein product [Caenorhabditis brenneri]
MGDCLCLFTLTTHAEQQAPTAFVGGNNRQQQQVGRCECCVPLRRTRSRRSHNSLFAPLPARRGEERAGKAAPDRPSTDYSLLLLMAARILRAFIGGGVVVVVVIAVVTKSASQPTTTSGCAS